MSSILYMSSILLNESPKFDRDFLNELRLFFNADIFNLSKEEIRELIHELFKSVKNHNEKVFSELYPSNFFLPTLLSDFSNSNITPKRTKIELLSERSLVAEQGWDPIKSIVVVDYTDSQNKLCRFIVQNHDDARCIDIFQDNGDYRIYAYNYPIN